MKPHPFIHRWLLFCQLAFGVALAINGQDCPGDDLPVFPLNSNFDSVALLNQYLYLADEEITEEGLGFIASSTNWTSAVNYVAETNELQKVMRFCIEVGPEAAGDYVLYLHDLQEVRVFHRTLENGPWLTTEAGTLLPIEQRQIYRGFLISGTGYSSQILLPLHEGTNTVFIRADYFVPKPFRPQIKLYEKQHWFTEVADRFYTGVGLHLLFIGAMLIMGLYHLLIYLQRRDITFFWYAAYALVVSGMLLIESGLFQVFITSDYPRLNLLYRILLPHALIGYLVYWMFLRSFVDLKRLFPRLDKILIRFLCLVVIAVLITGVLFMDGLYGNYRELRLIGYAIPLVCLLFGIVYFFLILRARKRLVNLFLAGSLILLLGLLTNTVISVAGYLGYIDNLPFPHFVITEVAVMIELLIFAFALGLRYQESENKRQRAEEINELKSRFFANVSHEFRTPLTVISGLAGQIKGNDQEVAIIKRNSHNLLELVKQLLDLARLNEGKMMADPKTADIIPYLNYLVESLYALAAEKEIRLSFFTEEDALIMDFDEEKIRQIVVNLLSNAIKFTPKGGKIVLSAKREKVGPKESLLIKVKDSGVGIAADQLPYVFDRFFQSDTAKSHTEESSGIGLALVKELTEYYEGEVKVSSKLGEGTVFTVILPIARTRTISVVDEGKRYKVHPEMQGEINDTETTPLADDEMMAANGKDRLLIVEDNQDIIVYLQKMLVGRYQILTAENGKAGIEKAIETIPDIIISDVMMPLMDGYAFTRAIKSDERTSHIPVILLTAKASRDDRIAGLQGGADAFLTKPFDQEELFIRLEQLVRLRRKLQKRYAGTDISTSTSVGEVFELEDQFVNKVTNVIEEHLDDSQFDVNKLCRLMSLSSTQLNRKLKAVTGKTANGFIRTLRLRKGKELLGNPDLNISEIAWSVGFNDSNYFSRAFAAEFGVRPREYRQTLDLSD